MHAIDQMKNTVRMKVHIDIAFIASALVQQIDWYIASITAELANILEIGFDQTVHERLVLGIKNGVG